MKEDNNPFRPTLSKPADDSVLANDPAADNFLTGNDRLANHQRTTVDGFPPVHGSDNHDAAAMPRLDQMMAQPAASQSNVNMGLGDPLAGMNIDPAPIETPATSPNVFEAVSANAANDSKDAGKSDKKKSKKHLLGRKKKDTAKAADPKAAATSVFGHSPAVAVPSGLMGGMTTTGHNDTPDPVTNAGLGLLDPSLATPGTDMSASLADNPKQPIGSITPGSLDGGNDDKSLASNSPISNSLAAAAAVADSKPAGTTVTTTDAKHKKANKNGQPKQLTISVLTIIFFLLFVVATCLAVYFYMQNNKNSDELSKTKASLQQLQDETNNSSNSSNKATTQFDALQDRIAELTTQNDEKQKTIDENNKTIDDLKNKNTELTNQVTEAQKKLTSDTQVSDKMQSLIVTLCTTEPYTSNSSVCVEANGGGNASNGSAQTNQQ